MPVKPAAKKPATAVPAKKPAVVPAKQESEEEEDDDEDDEEDEGMWSTMDLGKWFLLANLERVKLINTERELGGREG